MAQTALQELIEWMESTLMDGSSVYLKAKSLLPKERQIIINAYDAGKEQPSNSQLCPSDYFTQNFNH